MLTIDETGGLAAVKEHAVQLRRQIEDQRQKAVGNIQRQRQWLEDYERAEWDQYDRAVQPLETELEFIRRALAQVELRTVLVKSSAMTALPDIEIIDRTTSKIGDVTVIRTFGRIK